MTMCVWLHALPTTLHCVTDLMLSANVTPETTGGGRGGRGLLPWSLGDGGGSDGKGEGGGGEGGLAGCTGRGGGRGGCEGGGLGAPGGMYDGEHNWQMEM